VCCAHSGSTSEQYKVDTACTQFRVCEVCGQTETRVRHDWDMGWKGVGEIRLCTRCGKTETRGEQRILDNLREALDSLGVEATVSQRLSRYGDLIGVIDIHRSPISCIEVRKTSDYEGVTYWTRYMIPDSRLIVLANFRSVRVRTFPILGRVIDVRWEGDDRGTGAMDRLTADIDLKAAIVSAGAEIAVGSAPSQGWFITYSSTDAPSAGVFACYEKVARNLIQTKQTARDRR
jgi:hypothetical protein